MAPRFKLTLEKLDFVSLVDDPAQPNAKTLLIKRKGTRLEGETHARFVKTNDELGVAFFWAFTSTNPDGTAHYDLHGDAIDKTNLVKIAMDFMTTGGGAVDEMHDGTKTDARAVAFPMDPEIAKAFGVQTEVSGLMVMIKLNPEQLAKLKDGTYTGVSIAGWGTREQVEARKSGLDSEVLKGSLYTDEVDGHQHKIEVYDDGSMWCCGATSTGMENSHNHGVVFESGALTILADSGHTHQLAEGQPGLIVVPSDSIVISAEPASQMEMRRPPTTNRKRASESPRSAPAPTVKAQPEKQMTTPAEDAAKITDLEKQVVSLTARAERAERIAKLTGARKAHYDTLDDLTKVEYLAKSIGEQDLLIKAALDADPIEVEFEGTSYRKSHGAGMIALAKSAKAASEKAEAQEIEKQATAHLGNAAGDKADRAEIIKAIVSHTKTDLEKRAKLLSVLDGMNAIVKGRSRAPGGDGANVDVNAPANAYEALAKGLTAFCKTNKIDRVWTEGLPAFVGTPEGAALKSAHDEALAEAQG